MNDTIEQPPLTRRDLATRGLDALDPTKAGATKVSQTAGGVSFATAIEVMEFAKLMAVANTGVPKHLRNNPGACMRIVFQAIEWRMSPFAVADKSYEVNDRLAYESQLIHAVIEARAPLQHRLNCIYDGDGPTRTCTVTGEFTDGETRPYTTPQFKDIRVKNSPLWKDDPDQQLFYYASRSWARKWCPDVLMGIYSREELRENPDLGRDPDDTASAGLHSRLVSGPRSEEGHREGHAASELETIATGGKIIEAEPNAGGAETGTQQEQQGDGVADKDPKDGKRKKRGAAKESKHDADQPQPGTPAKAEPVAAPKTPEQYATYAEDWIGKSDDAKAMDKRWADERKMRNDIGVTHEQRQPIEAMLIDRREKLAAKA